METREENQAISREGLPAGTPSVAYGSALLFGAQVAANAGFFVAVLILARSLTPTQRGAVAFLTVSALVAARTFALGVSQTTALFVAQRPKERQTLLANLVLFIVGSAGLGGILVALVLGAVGEARPEGIDRAELAALAAGVLGAALLDAGLQFLVGLRRVRAQAVLTSVVPWTYACLLGGAWLFSSVTVLWAMVAWMIAHLVGGTTLLVVAARGVGIGRPSRRLGRETLAFAVKAWGGTLSRFLNFRTDQILMGFLATSAALGIYSVAVNMSEVVLYLPTAAATALLPSIAQARADARVEQALRSFRLLVLVTAATVVLAAVIGAPLLPILFGQKYEDSVAPFLWLLPGALGFAASAIFSSSLLGQGAASRSSVGPTVSLVVGLGLDLALIPPYGAVGAAIAASAAFFAGGAAAVVAFRRSSPFPLRELVPGRGELVALQRMARRRAR